MARTKRLLERAASVVRSIFPAVLPHREPETPDSGLNAGDVCRLDGVLEVRRDTIDEKARSIQAVVASERPIPGIDETWEIVDNVLLMDGDRTLPESVPLIDSHNRWTVTAALGSWREFAFERAGEPLLVARMYFSDNSLAREIWPLYRDKHLRDVSIAAVATAPVVRIAPGESAVVRGRTFTAGARALRVFVEWEIREISAVVKGADSVAKTRRSTERLEDTDMRFEEWAKQKGHKLEGLSEAQRAELHGKYLQDMEASIRADAEKKVREELARQSSTPAGQATPAQGTAQPADAQRSDADLDRRIADAIARATLEERRRRGEREKAVREMCQGFPDIERQALAEEWDDAKIGRAVTEALRKQLDSGVGSPAIHVRGGEMGRQALEDALLVRAQYEDAVLRDERGRPIETKQAEERVNRALDVRRFSLRDLCAIALRMDGREPPAREEELIREAFSTITLPQILGNVANKTMLRGYAAAASSWRSWCNIGSVSNFQEVTRARLTDMGELQEVTGAGEIPHGSAAEEYEKYAVTTYAKRFAITRKDIINDDLGVFTRTPERLGARAAQRISKLVYVHLLANGNMSDGNALFEATYHKNYVTASGYRLSAGAAALRIALQTFRQQTDKEGEAIDVQPRFILCAPEDEEYARALIASIKLAEGTTAGKATANIWGQMGLQVVVESRLSNSAYTGYSTTDWYLSADPNEADTVEVAFLNGQQNPTIERFGQMEMGIGVLGIGYRVYLDVGVKAVDWRGIIKIASAG